MLKAVAMKADVLLTHSNHLYSDRKQTEKMQPYPPLQTLLAAAVLRDHGIATALFDPTLEPAGDAANSCVRGVAGPMRSAPGSGLRRRFQFSFEDVPDAQSGAGFLDGGDRARPRDRAAVHGSDASDRVNEYLAAGFSFVLMGEVEETLLELASGQPVETIRGLAFREDGTLRYTQPREVNSDLDSLPLPAWDLVDVDRYRAAWVVAHGIFPLNMASSRGCPYPVQLVREADLWHSLHSRAARSVADEMLYLKTTFAPDHIWFADDIFALSPEWTAQFADAVEALDARIPFKMQSRCDLMTRDSVAALKRAGCAEVWMGANRARRRFWTRWRKAFAWRQIYEARENLRQAGIRACFFLQFGYPGEGWDDIEATIRMVRETAPDDIGVSVSYPLPGTKFYRDRTDADRAQAELVRQRRSRDDVRGSVSERVLSGAGRCAASRSARAAEQLSAAWERVIRRLGVAEAVA